MERITSMNCAYGGSVRYYASMLATNTPISFDLDATKLSKLRIHNHLRIAGANGEHTLTIPLIKPQGKDITPLRDIKISSHGDWERIHWGAIFSAYGKSPFFEYIENDLHSLYFNRSNWLVEFDIALHQMIVDFLDLPIITVSPDAECAILMPSMDDNYHGITDVEYYQGWKHRHGFIPGLSILDMLMNVGRESIVYLNRMAINQL